MFFRAISLTMLLSLFNLNAALACHKGQFNCGHYCCTSTTGADCCPSPQTYEEFELTRPGLHLFSSGQADAKVIETDGTGRVVNEYCLDPNSQQLSERNSL